MHFFDPIVNIIRVVHFSVSSDIVDFFKYGETFRIAVRLMGERENPDGKEEVNG